MSDYAVLDLFCGLGGFSQAFEESDRWHVTTVDIEARFEPDICADVFDLRPSDFEAEFDVVLASPPCTHFTTANRITGWVGGKPQTEDARDSLALVYHALGLIHGLTPEYWFLENPRGGLRNHLPRPTGRVTYCQYGRKAQKPTDLWGEHPPMTYRRCPQKANCHVNHRGERKNTQHLGDNSAERAKVPAELSQAVRDACEAGLDGEVPEQTTLEGINT